MTIFILIALLMTIVALALVLRPLLRTNQSQQEIDQDTANVDIYQQHLDELRQDLANKLISSEQFELASTELQKRLLGDTSHETQTATARLSVKPVLFAILIGLPLLSVSVYLALGEPRAIDKANIRQAGIHGNKATGRQSAPPIEVMADRLEHKLRQQPDNASGWLLLADTRRRLRQFDKAASAYANVVRLRPGSADILSSYADMLAAANGGTINKLAYSQLLKALKINPAHAKSLWLAGTWAYQNKRYHLAVRYWSRLRPLLPKGSDDARINEANIVAAQKKLGIEPGKEILLPGKPVPPAPMARINGRIRISKALASKLPVGATIFILAKAAKGPRVPLAVYKQPLTRLPIEFTLDDSQAMRPQLKLSNFRKVIVIVRISRSGQPFARPGDLEGRSAVLTMPVKGEVDIVIDRQIR
jgi:cytochrome c-type biogenesis protein CcmH